MKKKLSIIILLLYSGMVALAQGQSGFCGSIPPSEKDNVRFQKFEQYIYQQLNQPINARNASFGCATDQGNVITLPVVFHIIDSSATTIATNAQITQALKNLNDQWRRITGDGVDMKIQFALAVRDPFGNVTTGINRVSGRNVPNYLNYGLDLSSNLFSVLNLGNWRSDQYINIYIVTKLVGADGYGTLPTNVGYDGIFLIPRGTFDNGSVNLTHEMGHYLGLYHTFETVFNTSGNDCPDDNNCLLQGDRVCDTHPHKIGECSSTSCSGVGSLDNSFKNYMAYCGPLTRFTQGQKDRVRAALFSEYRISLISSPALIPVTTSLEASIDSIVYVNDLNSPLCGHKLDSVLIRVNNLGTGNVTSVKIGTYVAGVLKNTVTKSVMITTNSSKLVSVPAILFSAAGSYDLSFELFQINSNRIDFDTLNNKICTTVNPIILQVNTTTVANPPAGGTFTGGKTFTCSGIDTLRVFKNPGYDLIGIYDDGNFLTSDTGYYYPIDVNEFSTDKHFTAEFQIQTFRVTTSVNPTNAGTVTPGGTYDYGTNITLVTHKKPGYVFLHWKKNGVIYSTDSSISISVKEILNFVAVYDVATGIKNSISDINVSVYPNPTYDVVNISVVSRKKFTGSISVVNILGQNLLQESIVNASAADLRFDVSTFSTGSYFISLRDEEGNQEVYKFIVR